MLANLSMTIHSEPKNILVIGGGDGGVVREVLRHNRSGKDTATKAGEEGDCVKSVELVDIDGDVVEQSKVHFPKISSELGNPVVKVTIEDAVAFVDRVSDASYDIVIIDTTDP
uniref:Spermidine synthase n=1 Tax=Lygus hesperus TaxID=30085 RepID=A0A0A9WZ89_LYGHE